MASIPTLPSLLANATMPEVIDHVALLQKTLTFMMSSNLGTTNIAEVGGWLLDDTQIIAENNTVGLSSAITGLNDIRIWAGDSVTATAPFRVYEDGTMVASKATISGDITMISGSIAWNTVVKPTYTPGEVGAVADNQLAVFNRLTNNGLSRGLFLDVNTGQLFLNADYINAGKIKAVNIDTVNLSAEKIYQAGFPNNYAVLGGAYGDFVLYYNNTETFRIYNSPGPVSTLSFRNNTVPFMNVSSASSTQITTRPQGEWDFSGATHNITAKYG